MSKSKYAIRMTRLSNRIFGEIVTNTDQKSMKIVKIFSKLPAHKNPAKVDYYPKLRPLARLMEKLREEGLYRDEHEDMRDLMKERRTSKGVQEKVPYHIQKRNERMEELKAKEGIKEFE